MHVSAGVGGGSTPPSELLVARWFDEPDDVVEFVEVAVIREAEYVSRAFDPTEVLAQ